MDIPSKVITEIADFSDRINTQLPEDPFQRTVTILGRAIGNRELGDKFDKKLKELLPPGLREKTFSILVISAGLLKAGIFPQNNASFMQEVKALYTNPIFQKAVSDAYAFCIESDAPELRRDNTALMESLHRDLDNSTIAPK